MGSVGVMNMKKMLMMVTIIIVSFSACKMEFLPSLSTVEDTWIFAEGDNYFEVLTLEKGAFSWSVKQGANAELSEGVIIQQVSGQYETMSLINYGEFSYAIQLIPEGDAQQFTLNLEFLEGAETVWVQSGDRKSLFMRKDKYEVQFAEVESAVDGEDESDAPVEEEEAE